MCISFGLLPYLCNMPGYSNRNHFNFNQCINKRINKRQHPLNEKYTIRLRVGKP